MATKKVIYTIGHDQISQTVLLPLPNGGEGWGEGSTHWFGTDGHGSVRVLYDFAATIVKDAANFNRLQVYTFDAYGNLQGWLTSSLTPNTLPLTTYLYSGESFDFNIGQQYLRARFYDATTGRFNRLDPFAGNSSDPQSFHKYAYVHGDPIQGTDPTGKFTSAQVMAGIGIGMSVGALSGGIFGFMAGVLQAGDEPDLWSAFGTILHYTVTGVALGGLGGGVAGFAFVGAVPFLIVGGSGLAAAGLLKFNDVTIDELFAALPYLPFMATPNSWIRQLSPEIMAEAKKRDVPEELIASVLLYELNQINVRDTVGDREVFSGSYHSIGVAQLRYDNVRDWVPSQANASTKEIRNKLINPKMSVSLLAEAMAFWSETKGSDVTGTKISRSTWASLSQEKKEYVTRIYASAKDLPWGSTHNAAEVYGVRSGLHVVQSANSPLRK